MNGITFYDDEFLTISEDIKIVVEDLKRLLLTTPGERPNNTEFGCHLKSMLFEYGSDIGADGIRVVKNDIKKWLPNLEVRRADLLFKDDHIATLSLTLLDYSTREAFDYDLSLNF
jgi:phage baseplate assembly protein W